LSLPADSSQGFRAARDFLLATATDYHRASSSFGWPEPSDFNWALDWFDAVLAVEHADDRALWIVDPAGEQSWTFAQLAARSGQVANWLREQGVGRGDRVLVQLGNQVELWETLLALMKLGAVAVPTSPMLEPDEVAGRVARAAVRHLIVRSDRAALLAGSFTRLAVGDPVPGWASYADASLAPTEFSVDAPTRADDPLLILFTPGTTGRPKAIVHSHVSYPVGHLTTMYWVGLRPGDVHLSVSSPGWAKHLCGNVFAPWNAAATVLVYAVPQPSLAALLELMGRCEVTTMCAPPVAWRTLASREDLADWRGSLSRLRELVTVSEPLSPQVVDRIRQSWGLTVREGYGQSETTALLGHTPEQPVTLGAMGRALPGCPVVLLDPATDRPAALGAEGELCLDRGRHPLALMSGYLDDSERLYSGRYYRTGDVAVADELGFYRYIGRVDDVFHTADRRISPVELEGVLAEHEAVGDAAVVPASPGVPKAYVDLAAGYPADSETARAILRYADAHLLPYQRVRRLEFGPLPRTVSGKVRRRVLRDRELARADSARHPTEFRTEDFPELL
jgi:acetyl-CoA synthetase